MNAWFARLARGLPGAPELDVEREEARLVLELAGAAARSAGARQFAPIATYLAGRAAAGASPQERLALLHAAAEAATAAGPAAPLDVD
ncbi:MAG TPA: hypothetical protein VFO60_10285 [Candidatus Dormibacteraeota bacterium]|nr:hypothetical protein [Candidatus Dormibacteraeota bacterium]